MANVVTAVSQHTAETVSSVFDVDPVVIHNGIDTEFFHPNHDPPSDFEDILTDDVFLFVGQLVDRKRPMDVIRVAKNVPEATFLIRGGEGPIEQLVMSQAAKLDNVVAIPRLSKDDLASLYANVTGFIFPTVREGCPTVVLEAMASETPVVGYKATSMPELIMDGETGYLVDVGDIDELAERVRCLMSQKTQSVMGRAAREYILQHHNFDLISEMYQQAYLRALSPGSETDQH